MPKNSTLPFSTRRTTEESAQLDLPTSTSVNRKMPVFYNPVMKLNRDICIALLKQCAPLRILDALAASGVRSIRIASETHHTDITANDANPLAHALITHNAQLNNTLITTTHQDANAHLITSNGYDYIDLDVFGSPNPFLDSAITRLSRDGILAITATDTAPLCGTYPRACQRKYWATPLRNELKHEIGMRILIRKIQLIGTQYDKALTPLFVHSTDHYFRAYLRSRKAKSACDTLLKQHDTLWHCSACGNFSTGSISACTECGHSTTRCGPLYTGPLWDSPLTHAIAQSATTAESVHLLAILAKESDIPTIGYYDSHALCKRLGLRVPKTEHLLGALSAQGHLASQTHFSPYGIRTNAPYAVYKEILTLASKN